MHVGHQREDLDVFRESVTGLHLVIIRTRWDKKIVVANRFCKDLLLGGLLGEYQSNLRAVSFHGAVLGIMNLKEEFGACRESFRITYGPDVRGSSRGLTG